MVVVLVISKGLMRETCVDLEVCNVGLFLGFDIFNALPNTREIKGK